MKRSLFLLLLLSLVLPILFFGCSTEKDEDDYVDMLLDRRTRDQAMMYVQKHKTKKAVPVLLRLIEKRYGTLKAVYSLGIIGDPVAVPPLIEEIKEVATKDSLDHDRLTEQIAMTLGMIGATNAVDTLIWTTQKAGEMGRAGAVQALGMIGDPRATDRLTEVLMDEKEKLLIRHYAAIALGRVKAKEAADELVYALFVDDETGRNLFRDGQLSLIQINGKEARDALIKGYKLENEKAMELAKKIDLKEQWVQIKIVNVMGQMRDAELADFLMAEYEKGRKNDLVYEIFAKIIQALERTPLKKEQLATLAEHFTYPVRGTEFLNERELMSRVFIWANYTEKLDDIMNIAEKGDIRLKNAKGQFQNFSQWCFAAANVVSMLADSSMADRFNAFVESGKCDAQIWGQQKSTKEMLKDFNTRMQAAKKCKDNMSCWQRTAVTGSWPEREKALWVLANSGDSKYMKEVLANIKYPNEQVRLAVSYGIWNLATPDYVTNLIRYWQDEKIKKDFQKITEDIGYMLYIKMREWNLDDPQKRDEIFYNAEHLSGPLDGLDVTLANPKKVAAEPVPVKTEPENKEEAK